MYDIFGGDRDKYLARDIILNRLEKTLDGEGIGASSSSHVHLVCTSADSLMLNIARQAALLCHFPNFDEKSGSNRTKITILDPSAGSEKDLRNILALMSTESLLGNLLTECCWQMRIHDTDTCLNSDKRHPFVDIEIEVIGYGGKSIDSYWQDFNPGKDELTTVVAHQGAISSSEIQRLRHICHQVHVIDADDTGIPMAVDIRKARRANIVYDRGTSDRNIFNDNLKDAKAYMRQLRRMIRSISRRDEEKSWDGIRMPEINRFSNLCCTDCYPYYLRSACHSGEDAISSLIRNVDVMSRTEHARWNVEKLIMGFRPLTPEERLEDELRTGKERAGYRKKLKSDKIHIDLCPMHRLKCIDPDSLKYDSFLVLAIPAINESLK